MDERACATQGCARPCSKGRRYCGHCRHARWPGDPERAKARQRAKTHLRKTVGRQTDITLDYEQALRRKARRCPLCQVRMTGKPYLPTSKELDHIVPLNAGGTHTVGNVRIICRTCNLARPKDGSDYTGPVTLWAQEPGFVQRPRRVAKPVPPRIERRARREVDGRRAAELRAEGWKWVDIASALGFSNGGSCQGAATMHGAPEVVAQWPGRYVHAGPRRSATTAALRGVCVDCGDPAVPHTERCGDCLTEVSES